MPQTENECGLLAAIVTLTSVAVGLCDKSPRLFLEALCLLLIALGSVATELGGRSEILDIFSPRSVSTSMHGDLRIATKAP